MAQVAIPSLELLRESTDDELEAVIKESQQAILELKTQAQFASPEKPHLIRTHKKLIARCKTLLRERS